MRRTIAFIGAILGLVAIVYGATGITGAILGPTPINVTLTLIGTILFAGSLAVLTARMIDSK